MCRCLAFNRESDSLLQGGFGQYMRELFNIEDLQGLGSDSNICMLFHSVSIDWRNYVRLFWSKVTVEKSQVERVEPNTQAKRNRESRVQ